VKFFAGAIFKVSLRIQLLVRDPSETSNSLDFALAVGDIAVLGCCRAGNAPGVKEDDRPGLEIIRFSDKEDVD
jgi:hypothetical protein